MSFDTAVKTYTGKYLTEVLFPLGGIGAGMIGITGTGALSSFSLRNKPDLHHHPNVFSALCVKTENGELARVLEGPVPVVKTLHSHGVNAGNGLKGKNYGLPRLEECSFSPHFPFAKIELKDSTFPIAVTITAWSPFTPPDADSSSLPAAFLEYELTNTTDETLATVFSFHSQNFMKTIGGERIEKLQNGFCLYQQGTPERPWEEGSFIAALPWESPSVDCAWFRGGWYDTLSVLWNNIQSGSVTEAASDTEGLPSPGASLYQPISLSQGETRTLRVLLCWYVSKSDMRYGIDHTTGELYTGAGHYAHGMNTDIASGTYSPWYAERFSNIDGLYTYLTEQYDTLRAESLKFADSFYSRQMPPEVLEAAGSNLSIFKSPTMLRQTDGRLWCWEGSFDTVGSCAGTCTHVWNYAQATAHLFPSLERTLRETEFGESQNEEGHQQFRASLPIRRSSNNFHAAADGQLGGIMKLYRDWKISGDDAWLKKLWPRAKKSLDYCIRTWDPDERGVLTEPHHNTYDIEFWGVDGMCTSFYLGALTAAKLMSEYLGEDSSRFARLYASGRAYIESELFNGEYFIQKVQWEGLRSKYSVETLNHENLTLFLQEGPKYQYGNGCLSDGVLGAWLARMCALPDILDAGKIKSHLLSVYRYNMKKDLFRHANPERPGYAFGHEGGLLLCTWPKGGRPTLPFIYSDEVWTGIEYQVASHLILIGCKEEGLDIVRASRSRYTGEVRNPFDEYECGHWYGRALASYGLLIALEATEN